MTQRRMCIATVVTDGFLPGAEVLIRTLLRTNPWFDGDLVVLHNDDVARLGAESRTRLTDTAPGIRFRHVDLSPYRSIFAQRDAVLRTPDRLLAAFVILDAFRLSAYERVVCLDSDMMVLGDLSELFELDCEFAAVMATDERSGENLDYFNTGVMVIGPNHLTGATFEQITGTTVMSSVDRERGKADQAVLNRFFESRPYDRLPLRYNVTKRMVPDQIGDIIGRLHQLDARILHFVGAKPWNLNWSERDWGYETAEALWLDEHLAGSNLDDVARFFERRRTLVETTPLHTVT